MPTKQRNPTTVNDEVSVSTATIKCTTKMESTQISNPEQKYFSLKSAREFAKKFADYDLSEASFYRLSSKGKIPVIKGPGGRLLIPIDKFIAWLESGSEANGEA